MSDNLHNTLENRLTELSTQALSQTTSESVLFSYCGKLNPDIIATIETSIEEKITSQNIPKGPFKKIFFISVEALQNVLLHGHKASEDAEYLCLFYLLLNENSIRITCCNYSTNDAIPSITKQIEYVNQFDDEKELKAYYLQQLENNELSSKGGAGLGFISIALKSGNKLAYKFDTVESVSLFSLTATISLN